MTETEARKAFNNANAELQMALTQYQSARTSLHRITGEFVATDHALSLQFSSALAGQQGTDASQTQAQADC